MEPSLINTWDQMKAAKTAGLPDVFIELDTHMGTRSHYTVGWRVLQQGVELDPAALPRHWSVNHAGKCFRESDCEGSTTMQRRSACLEIAKTWASEKFGVTEWKRNAFRDYVDARVDKQFPLSKQR
jgi:hypothetical protein